MTTPEQHADQVFFRSQKLMSHIASQSVTAADAGLLLCASLAMVIMNITGGISDGLTLKEMTELFVRIREQEMKGTRTDA
jgi:hypothetical protein